MQAKTLNCCVHCTDTNGPKSPRIASITYEIKLMIKLKRNALNESTKDMQRRDSWSVLVNNN